MEENSQDRAANSQSMSYKFQRLRERIRQAVASGELSGKLPGERELARRFHVNAKTLSKALTDLAAEGLLQRSIGRGTFVQGTGPNPVAGAWLLISNWSESEPPVVSAIRAANPETKVVHDVSTVRPSFINQFQAVIDLTGKLPPDFVRDLIVRGITFVAVGYEPRTYTTHAVLSDVSYEATCLGRDLMIGGHRRFLAVQQGTCKVLSEALRKAAARYAPDATVDVCFPRDVPGVMEFRPTALLCDSLSAAQELMKTLAGLDVQIPADLSVAVVGCASDELPCSGYSVSPQRQAQAVIELLRGAVPGRPTMLWLAGIFHDMGTTGPIAMAGASDAPNGTSLRFPAVAV